MWAMRWHAAALHGKYPGVFGVPLATAAGEAAAQQLTWWEMYAPAAKVYAAWVRLARIHVNGASPFVFLLLIVYCYSQLTWWETYAPAAKVYVVCVRLASCVLVLFYFILLLFYASLISYSKGVCGVCSSCELFSCLYCSCFTRRSFRNCYRFARAMMTHVGISLYGLARYGVTPPVEGGIPDTETARFA
jgi:hypothetical protein